MVTHIDESAIPAVYNEADIPSHQNREGVSFQFFRSLHNIFAFVTIEPGGERNYHEHPWEQVVRVVDGEADFYIDPEEFPIEAGDVFFIPPSVEHELRPRPDASCELFVTWPFREEFAERVAYQAEFQT
ncbi:MAG: cupin domain-containing protein [Halobacteriales archaeon]|nr:cupin domain-containing protein [Halobacteriales archaeon]